MFTATAAGHFELSGGGGAPKLQSLDFWPWNESSAQSSGVMLKQGA